LTTTVAPSRNHQFAQQRRPTYHGPKQRDPHMAADQAQSVAKIFLSRQAFELVSRANYLLSMHEQKQRQLQQVIAHMLDTLESFTQTTVTDLKAMSPLGGDTAIFVRLDGDEAAKLKRLRNNTLETYQIDLPLREAVIALCLSLIEKFS